MVGLTVRPFDEPRVMAAPDSKRKVVPGSMVTVVVVVVLGGSARKPAGR